MTDFKLLQQALDALEFPHDSEWSNKAKAIEALQHALAQPMQEPTECGYDETVGLCTNNPCCEQAQPEPVPFPSFMRRRIEQTATDEREACAKLCDEEADQSSSDDEAGGMYWCAKLIRARGNHEQAS